MQNVHVYTINDECYNKYVNNKQIRKGDMLDKMKTNKIKSNLANTSKIKQNVALSLLCLPGVIWVICFCYLPMFGVVVAFKDYNYIDGILHSPWVGFRYFKYFFTSNDAGVVIRNTLGYNLIFMFINQIAPLFVALCLYEMKKSVKVYQTAMILPNFISWVLVAYIGYAFFSQDTGIINAAIKSLGGKGIQWYSEPKYWPAILVIFNLWKNTGMGSILYYASLCAIDASLFEAAEIDGAKRFKQIIYISLPEIAPVICILLIMSVGTIMGGDFGLFYQVPRNSGALYSVTDIIPTYIYRLLQNGNMSYGSAVGLFQNLVGAALLLVANFVIKKINPENALF